MGLRDAVRRFLTPPASTDPDEISIVRILCGVAIAVAAIVTFLALLMVVLTPATAVRGVLAALVVDAACAVLLVLGRGGHAKAAGRLFAIGSWAVMTIAAAATGGVTAPSIIAQPVIPVIAVMVLGWQEGLVAAVVTVLTVFGLAWAQVAGLLPQVEFAQSPFARSAVIASWVVILATLEVIVAHNIRVTRDRAVTELGKRRVVQRRLSDMIDNAPFASFSFELGDDGRLVVTHANRSADRILGVDATRFIGMTLDDAFPHLSETGVEAEFRRVAEDGGTFDLADLPYSGATFHGVLELHAFQTAARCMTVFFSDVTEKRKAEEQVRYMAYHDPLTQLPNRKLFNDRLGVALANAQRGGELVGLLFVDMDGFKPVNDRYGHAFGDELLVAIGERLRTSARAGDTVARFGGDEFMVLLPQVAGIAQIETVARKLLAVLAEPFEIDCTEVAVGASVGLSMTSDDDYDAASLLQRADRAMYRMKSEGRGGFRIWE